MNFGILRLYCGASGSKGFYNLQELGLAKSMAKLGYNTYIILLDNNIKTIKIEKYNDNINFVTFPCKKIGNHGVFKCRYLLDLNINLLQISSDNQIYAPNVMKFCKKNKIKFYNYVGAIETDSKSNLKKIISNFINKRNIKALKNGKVFAKTPYVKEKLSSLKVDAEVLPVGLDTDNINTIFKKQEIIKKYNLPKDKKYVIFVGRLENYKNPLYNIELLNKLNEQYHLILVGKGSLKNDILSSIKDNNLESRVTYIEQVSNKEIHELYNISTYFVNFNTNEIFGMSILEAIYNGNTVVAFHAPGPDYILNNDIGYLVSTVNEMADIINKEKIIDKNYLKDIIISKFNWDNNAIYIEHKLKNDDGDDLL